MNSLWTEFYDRNSKYYRVFCMSYISQVPPVCGVIITEFEDVSKLSSCFVAIRCEIIAPPWIRHVSHYSIILSQVRTHTVLLVKNKQFDLAPWQHLFSAYRNLPVHTRTYRMWLPLIIEKPRPRLEAASFYCMTTTTYLFSHLNASLNVYYP